MSRVRSRDNRAELALRREIWRRGYRYRLFDKRLPGTPDLVFPKYGVVVFVDGDYWHGRALVEGNEERLRKSFRTERRDWWVAKISRNVARDRQATEALRDLGWAVVRLWERDVLADLTGAADAVQHALELYRRDRGSHG
jgi:DNA mismatch endonuclease, patch repair protein